MKPLAGLVAALGLTLPGAAHAQVIPPPAPLPARGVHVSERPGATLVAVTVVIPAGSAEDPPALPGAARLVAETVAQVVRWRIDPDASQLDVRVERGWTAFTLLAAADVWERSWAVLEDAFLRLPLGDAPMEAARARLIAGFAFEEGTPVHEFQRELYRTIAGASDPWSRDPRGIPSALAGASLDVLAAFHARQYVPARATAAVVSPITEREGRAALEPLGITPPLTGSSRRAPAWDDEDRLEVERQVTNAWIGVAFPAHPALPRTRLEFVAHQLKEALNPSPPDPGVYAATVNIKDTPRGPVIVAQAAVMPEATGTWERRIRAAMARLEDEPAEALFRWQRRRFRSAILLREGVPEEAALRMALDLMRDGRVRPLQEEVWEIGPEEVADAAAALEEPRILLMGPDLGGP